MKRLIVCAAVAIAGCSSPPPPPTTPGREDEHGHSHDRDHRMIEDAGNYHVGLTAPGCLVAVTTAVLLAHEGHAPLPARGAAVDVERGHVLLTEAARAGIDVETAAVEVRAVEERVPAYASLAAPWQNRGFATS